MDPRDRIRLVSMLTKEMLRSTDAALRASKEWEEINDRINKSFGGSDSADARIRKRDHLPMKDAMAKYVWHRDNAQFCASVLTALGMWAPEETPASQMMEAAAQYVERLEEEHAAAARR